MKMLVTSRRPNALQCTPPEVLRQLPHGIAFRFVHIKLGDAGRVKITQARSRSCETDWVLSVPPLSLPSRRA